MPRDFLLPVASMWDRLSPEFVRSDTSAEPVGDMRRASYAGAWAVLREVEFLSRGRSLEPEVGPEEAARILAAMELELNPPRVGSESSAAGRHL